MDNERMAVLRLPTKKPSIAVGAALRLSSFWHTNDFPALPYHSRTSGRWEAPD